jgi:FkbM family methyltransferase
MKVYIDCGAYNGNTIKNFLLNPQYGSKYKIYAFECNPVFKNFNYGNNVIIINKACWIYDGEISFYINPKSPKIEGPSIYKEKVTGGLDKEHPISVPCFDFSTWLINTFSKEDYIVIKMNIEGAEYDVLEKCINDKSINLIKELYVKFHYGKIKALKDRHNNLIHNLKNISTLLLHADASDSLRFFG